MPWSPRWTTLQVTKGKWPFPNCHSFERVQPSRGPGQVSRALLRGTGEPRGSGQRGGSHLRPPRAVRLSIHPKSQSLVISLEEEGQRSLSPSALQQRKNDSGISPRSVLPSTDPGGDRCPLAAPGRPDKGPLTAQIVGPLVQHPLHGARAAPGPRAHSCRRPHCPGAREEIRGGGSSRAISWRGPHAHCRRPGRVRGRPGAASHSRPGGGVTAAAWAREVAGRRAGGRLAGRWVRAEGGTEAAGPRSRSRGEAAIQAARRGRGPRALPEP